MKPPSLPDFHVKLILNEGGLGDNVCRLPALNLLFTQEEYSHVKKVTLASPDYFVPILEHFFGHDPRLEILPFSKTTREQLSGEWWQTKSFMHTPHHTHLVDIAFRYILDKDVDISQKNYLQFDLERLPDVSRFSLPARYVVITCGYTAAVRALPASTINAISDWTKARGYEPVFLGNKSTARGTNERFTKSHQEIIEASYDEGIDFKLGLDLREQTSLLEAAKIMSGASCVLGLDNGLLHVAGCTSVPIIAAFTNASPIHRLPIRNSIYGSGVREITPPGCHACQSTTNFHEADTRNCVYQLACPEKLTADLFIRELEKIL